MSLCPYKSLDSNESQCQVTDTTPKSMTDEAVTEPRSGPSTNANDPLLCSLHEPEPNTGLLQIMTAIEVHGTSVSEASTSPMGRELSHQPEAIQNIEAELSKSTTCH